MSEYPPPDERELTRHLISLTSQNRHFLHYQISQRQEAGLGADWLWLIVTNSGITPLMIQAKKLKENEKSISKRAIGYVSSSGKRQNETLLVQSERTGIPALYVLFSNHISHVPCRKSHRSTQEGVFIDSAKNLNDYWKSTNKDGLKHLPLSCLFACMARKCHYNFASEANHRVCKVCNGCKYTNCWKKNKPEFECPAPITRFLKIRYGLKCYNIPLSVDFLPLIFAHSALCENTPLALEYLKEHVCSSDFLPSDLIITDYLHRHNNGYLQDILGADFSYDKTSIHKKSFIVSVLKTAIRKYPLFEAIGLFGSYSRGQATPLSDIDIALVYQKERFDRREDIDLLCSFITDIIQTFQKKIDFVDYTGASTIQSSRDFIAEINRDMIWIVP